MEDFDDEKVRMIFSRLQRGKPLRLGEILNAKPGKIVETVRKLAKHDFLEKSIAIAKNRYTLYEEVARLMFYEEHGAKNYSTDAINIFFAVNKDSFVIDSKKYASIVNTLNILLRCFPAVNGPYAHLERHTWVLTVFTVIYDLKNQYSFIGYDEEIGDFIKKFHSKIYNENFRKSNYEYARYYDAVRGGWSEKLIAIRRDILKHHLLEKINLKELDVYRQISNEEKIQIFSIYDSCDDCGKEFKDYKEPEYHHVVLYSEGGQTTVDNIVPLCSQCHSKIHSRKEFNISNITDEDLVSIEAE